MSFVRMGQDGSQVYIYDDTSTGPNCCFCLFTEELPDRTDGELAQLPVPHGADPEIWRKRWGPDFATHDLDAMLAHVQRHRDAGHTVPAWLDQRLRDQWPSTSDNPADRGRGNSSREVAPGG